MYNALEWIDRSAGRAREYALDLIGEAAERCWRTGGDLGGLAGVFEGAYRAVEWIPPLQLEKAYGDLRAAAVNCRPVRSAYSLARGLNPAPESAGSGPQKPQQRVVDAVVLLESGGE